MDFNQLTLPCTDYGRSVQFYKKLGFTQIVDSPPRYARFESKSGTTFSIHLVDANLVSSGYVIYFEVADVDEKAHSLKADGFEFEGEPTDQTWLWREARLRDPAGNLICIYHAGDNRRFPPWRVPMGSA